MAVVDWYDGVVVATARVTPGAGPVLCILLAFDPNRRGRTARLYGVVGIDEESCALISKGAVASADQIDETLSLEIDARIDRCIRSASGTLLLVHDYLEPDVRFTDCRVLSADEHRALLTWTLDDAVDAARFAYWTRFFEGN